MQNSCKVDFIATCAFFRQFLYFQSIQCPPALPHEALPGASAGGRLRMMAGWGGSSSERSLTRRGGNGDNGGKCYGLVKLAKCSVKRVACKPRQIGATASCKFASAGKMKSWLEGTLERKTQQIYLYYFKQSQSPEWETLWRKRMRNFRELW